MIDGLQSRKEQGLAALAEAERLYKAESNNEGQTEVLIRRGGLLSAASDLAAAHDAFERAQLAARSFGNSFQEVRAQMQLGSAMVSEGHFAEQSIPYPCQASAATDFDEVSGASRPTLRHGRASQGDISNLKVGTEQPCSFSSASALTRICISPDDPQEGCEEQ